MYDYNAHKYYYHRDKYNQTHGSRKHNNHRLQASATNGQRNWQHLTQSVSLVDTND